MNNDLCRAAELIRQADGILITAGAGMSVDSGLPDFRSVGGFWNAYPPLEKFGLGFMDIATPDAYQENPQLAYWFFGHRLQQYRNTEPHAGYQILQRWAATKPHGAFVFTSNVDGHFQKSGFADDQVYEVHGTLNRLQCMENCADLSWRSDGFQPLLDNEQCRLLSEPPRCPKCGGLARQNVLLFDDWYYSDIYQSVKKVKLDEWIKKVEKLVVIELGAGKAIPTVRLFSERIAKQKKGGFIRINPQDGGVICKEKFVGLKTPALATLQELENIKIK